MAKLWIVGQALVTDPLIGRSSGYALVGRSPSVPAGDGALLESKPLITDYLHAETKPAPFLAFFRLPSGLYALSRRFIHGQRRGTFNRVAAHTLIVSEELLGALDFEPTLLISHCRYRLSDGSERNLAEIGEGLMHRLGGEGTQAEVPLPMADLTVGVPDDILEARWTVLRLRLQHLLKIRPAEQLERELAAAYTVLERGHRLLLPQGSTDEQLLFLLWSALPWHDRRELFWTSHLAPTASDLFSLANAPEPDVLVPKLGQREPWHLLPGASAGASETAAALARWLVAEPESLPRHLDDARRHEVRLVGGRGRLSALARWLQQGGDKVLGGFPSLAALQGYLAGVGGWQTGWPEDGRGFVWQHPAYHLLVVCATAKNLSALEPLPNLRRAVLTLLEDTRTAQTLLQPAVMQAMAGEMFTDVGAAEIAAAVWLILDPDAGPPPMLSDVLELWDVFSGLRPPPMGAGRQLYVEAAVALASAMTRDSQRLDQLATGQVMAWGEGLERVAAVLAEEGRTAEASRLCRQWWGWLFRRWPETWPLDRLGMLRRLTPEDRDVLIADLCERLPSLPESPQNDRLVDAVGEMVPDGSGSRVVWQEAVLRREVRLGRADVVEAFRRAVELLDATDAASFEEQLVRRARTLLAPGQGQTRKLFALLLAPELGVRVQLALGARLLEGQLNASRGEWVADMPTFEQLAFYGPLELQLEVARHLGRDWSRDSARAVDFLLEAARAERFDVHGSFFRGERENKKLDLLRNLDRDHPAERELLTRLIRAIADPRHRFDLRRVAGRLRQLEGESL